MHESRPPVSEGEEHNVMIDAVGEKGDGIARVNGFVLFVPNTQTGDRKRVKITKVLAKVGFAEVIGEATGEAPKREHRQKREKAPEPDFDPQTELDSEDF